MDVETVTLLPFGEYTFTEIGFSDGQFVVTAEIEDEVNPLALVTSGREVRWFDYSIWETYAGCLDEYRVCLEAFEDSGESRPSNPYPEPERVAEAIFYILLDIASGGNSFHEWPEKK